MVKRNNGGNGGRMAQFSREFDAAFCAVAVDLVNAKILTDRICRAELFN